MITTETLSPQEVAARVRPYVTGRHIGAITLQIDDARVHLRNGYWNIPIRPSRWPDPLFPYYEALAEIEDRVQENEDLKVTLVSSTITDTNEEFVPGEPAYEIVPLENIPVPEPAKRNSFADYKGDARDWITLVTGEYYPDILVDACILYEPVLRHFGMLLRGSESSIRLLLNIANIPTPWMRVQVARVFRKYVSPETPVEMLKQKSKAQKIADDFGGTFRPIQEVQAAFRGRPIPDEAICAILWEYKDRGKKGYDLTTRFFELFRAQFPSLLLTGPERAGQDIRMGTVFADYPYPTRPVDFVIREGADVLAIGLARYDGDRGGAQEDDRTGAYKNCADEILTYCDQKGMKRVKVLFMNDGPGLLLGSMWNDYASIEAKNAARIRVFTLRMLPERITLDWLRSEP